MTGASTYRVDLAPWFVGVWLSTSFRLRCESWPSEAGSFCRLAWLLLLWGRAQLSLFFFSARRLGGFFSNLHDARPRTFEKIQLDDDQVRSFLSVGRGVGAENFPLGELSRSL